MTTHIFRTRVAAVARRALAGAAFTALIAGLSGALPGATTPAAAQVDPNACDILVSCGERGAIDSDGDGISDLDESDGGLTGYVTDPNDLDTDDDFLDDDYEIYVSGTDPTNADSDGDGLPDGYEVGFLPTNPNNWDSDGDGWGDGTETGDIDPNGAHCAPSNPVDPASMPQCPH
jgi:hypothetical protein